MANPAIIAFAAADAEFKRQQNEAIDGITGDITSQAELIKQLQARPDGWTPEDQSILDAIQANSDATTKRLQALNDLTPPAVPALPAGQ